MSHHKQNTKYIFSLVALLGRIWFLLFNQQSHQNVSQLGILPTITVNNWVNISSWSTPWQIPSKTLIEEPIITGQSLNWIAPETLQSSAYVNASWATFYEQRLQQLYATSNDPKILKLLLLQLLQEYQFEKALTIINQQTGEIIKQFGVKNYMYTLLNSSALSSQSSEKRQSIKDKIQYFVDKWDLSPDDKAFYNSIVDLAGRNISGALVAIKSISDLSSRKSMKTDLLSAFSTYQSFKEVSESYLYALLGLSLFKHGYPKISQLLAAQSAAESDSYILPHQILAYTHLLMNDRDLTVSYLAKLKELDKQNNQLYILLMGIAYYRQNLYPDAILQFSQIKNPDLLPDTERYLMLSYFQQGDIKNMMVTLKKFLNQGGLTGSDFVTIFDLTLYRPRMAQPQQRLVDTYSDILLNLLQTCYTNLGGDQQAICKYGKIWLELSPDKTKDISKDLLPLLKNLQHPSLYQALGEYYLATKQKDKATTYFLKGLFFTQDPLQKRSIASQLKTLQSN